MKKILVPVDGSEQSCKAAQWAAETGASVTLLHVHVLESAETMSLAHQSSERIKAIEEQHAIPCFDKAREAMGNIAPEATLSTLGKAGEEIVSHARAGGFDHIAMGSRGRSPVRELFLGSVSVYVLHHAHCPVTVIR
jgi:nucleotide-binding universal stress UspA family protein